MSKFKFIETGIQGLVIVEPTVYSDKRGFFMETYSKNEFFQNGIDREFVQDNHSKSSRGVVRGLHFQKDHPQGKLVRVIRGNVFDVAVDIRRGSPTYGQWRGVELSQDNRRQLYIPEGFAHGFAVLSDIAEFTYKCTEFYYPEDEGGIIWNDPEIGIEWPLDELGEVTLSNKDSMWKMLAETDTGTVKWIEVKAE